MRKMGIRARTIAAVTALTVGLSGCEAMIRDVCGERPEFESDPGYIEWKSCRDRVVASGAIVGLIIISALAIGAVVASDDGDGDGGGGGGGGTD